MKEFLVEPLSDRTALLDDGGFLFNSIFMIYKFKKEEQDCILEVENITDTAPVSIVEFTIIAQNGTRSISLYKEDVYKLIGALHLIIKEMK